MSDHDDITEQRDAERDDERCDDDPAWADREALRGWTSRELGPE